MYSVNCLVQILYWMDVPVCLFFFAKNTLDPEDRVSQKVHSGQVVLSLEVL